VGGWEGAVLAVVEMGLGRGHGVREVWAGRRRGSREKREGVARKEEGGRGVKVDKGGGRTYRKCRVLGQLVAEMEGGRGGGRINGVRVEISQGEEVRGEWG